MGALKYRYSTVAVHEGRKYWKEEFYNNAKEKTTRIEDLKSRRVDAYNSVNEFSKPQRSEATVTKLNSLICDIDCHDGVFNEWLVMEILRSDFFGTLVPQPSEVINSGRGLHLYWFLDNETADNLAKWKAIQSKILEDLKPISEQTNCSVDFKCADPSRVLRIIDTFNTKSKTYCRLVEKSNIRYTLDELLECFYGVELDDLKPFVKKGCKITHDNQKALTEAKKWAELRVKRSDGVVVLFNAHNLLVSRAHDFKKLLALRNGKMTGKRDEFLTMYAWTVIAKNDDLEKVERELQGINALFTDPLSEKDISYKAEYIFKKFNKEVVKGDDPSQFTEFDRYWYRNTTIINRLEITMKEQSHMLTIISKEEKNRRKCEREKATRRNENGLTRKQQEKLDRYNTIQELKRLGYKQKAVSETLNISVETVKRQWK